jgi:hypothetical protein
VGFPSVIDQESAKRGAVVVRGSIEHPPPRR